MGRIQAILAGLAAASIWGGMYVVSKVVLRVIPPFGLLTLRLLVAAVALGAVLALRGSLRPTRTGAVRLLSIGMVGFGLSLGLQFVGTRLSTAANASLVTSASPLFMVLFAALLLRERAGPRRLAALICASLGVLAVVDPSSASLTPDTFVGNLALLGAALTWGLYSVLIKGARRWTETVPLALYTILGGTLLALPAAVLESMRLPWGRVDGLIVLGILYLGLVSTALAVYLWARSLEALDAGLVSLLFFAQPVVGAGLGALLLAERLSLGFWIGGALIGAGLLLDASDPAGRLPSTMAAVRSSAGGVEEGIQS